MALHGLSAITMGVPNPDETRDYYTEFGLTPEGGGWLSTTDGGRQLNIVQAPTRRLVELAVRAEDHDDLDRIARQLEGIGSTVERGDDHVSAIEPVAGFKATVHISDKLVQLAPERTPYNAAGRSDRTGRAPGILREGRVTPRRLGHVVMGSLDYEVTRRFFTEGLGFKVSDEMVGHGAFMRCSTDHHNVLVLGAPVNFLHHSSWQVDDVDDVGRGAFSMLENNPERHVWGLGRHYAGSNFFWYLKDPAGNFSEYYSDMDEILDDQVWSPEALEGAKGLFSWGPPPPPSFLAPEDLASLMTGAHQAG